jgi:uncharacterized protein YjbI with pentapeptide repeats
MDEQQNATTDSTELDDSEPTPERQAELRKAYEANVAASEPPYAGIQISTRGELKWIIGERGWQGNSANTRADLPNLANSGITGDFSGINLTASNLSGIFIQDANLSEVDLSFANLSGAVVATSNLTKAVLAGANLSGSMFVDSNFTDVDLSAADLSKSIFVQDEGENQFFRATLQMANLSASLIAGNFGGADMIRARMDGTTAFGGYGEKGRVHIDSTTRLLDVAWNGAVLALVNWSEVPRLGDEADIKEASSRKEHVQAYREAARAYHGLAKALEAQGITVPALRYRRRQHQLERAAQLRSFNLLGWLFSSALNIVSGYGDRPLRALGVYLAVIFAFAGIYFGITTPGSPIFFGGSQPLQFHEAVVFSLSSFHGRGFFPSTIGLGDPVAIVAALEAVVGLFIELVLIATFTRRLFER